MIERVVELADALGGDPEGGAVAEARADFEAASEALTEARVVRHQRALAATRGPR